MASLENSTVEHAETVTSTYVFSLFYVTSSAVPEAPEKMMSQGDDDVMDDATWAHVQSATENYNSSAFVRSATEENYNSSALVHSATETYNPSVFVYSASEVNYDSVGPNDTSASADSLNPFSDPPPLSVLFMVCLLVLVAMIGVFLCCSVLDALRKTRKVPLRSRWCLCQVLVADVVLGSAQVLKEVWYLGHLVAGQEETALSKCIVDVIASSLLLWSVVPALLASLCLGVDNLLAVAWPLQTMTKAHDRLKRTVFSLIIWGPPAVLEFGYIGGTWLSSGDRSCQLLVETLRGKLYPAVGCLALGSSALVVMTYCILLALVLAHASCSRFRKRSVAQALKSQRKLITISLAIFLTTVLVWAPISLYSLLGPQCAPESSKPCEHMSDMVFLSMLLLHTLTATIDPLLMAWRLPVLRTALFGRRSH